MNNQEQEDLRARVGYLEARVQALERLAGLYGPTSQSVPPPPPRIVPERTQVVQAARPAPPAPPGKAPSSAPARLDYEIGAKILPKLGAVAMLAGFGFLVSLAVNRGWITPAMLFGFVCLVCAGFIGVGLRMREEREQFGQILIAIGSGALYMNFAAGHVFQHLYSGEVLVALCLSLSLAVIGGSWRFGSLVFLVLGSLGGFGAALMPLDEGKALLSVGLHLSVLVAALVVAVRHKLLLGTVSLYVLGMLASLPLALSPSILRGHYVVPSMEFGLTVALSVLAYGYCLAETALDPRAAFAPLALLIGGFSTLGAGQYGRDGLFLCLGLALVTGVCAIGFRPALVRSRIWLGAGAIVCWVAPFAWWVAPDAWNNLQAATVFGALALATGILGTVFKWRGFPLLSGVGLAFAVCAYLGAALDHAHPLALESATLLVLIGASLSWGRATWLNARVPGHGFDPAILNAVGIVAGLCFVRLTYLLLWTLHLTPELVAALAGFAGICALLSAIALAFHRLEVAILAGAAFVITCLVYINAIGTPFPFGWDASCLLLLLALTALASGALWSSLGGQDQNKEAVILQTAAFLSGCALARLMYLVLWALHVATQNVDAVLGLSAVSLGLALFALRFARAKAFGLPTVFALLGGAFYVAVAQSDTAPGWEVVANAALLLAWLGSLFGLRRAGASVPALCAMGVLGVWVLMSRFGFVALGSVGVGQTTALTVTWLALAAVFMAGGFLRDLVELRYSSFALMGMTALKVVLVDLAQVDPAIRVLLLMGLGAVMLGGGYWTIRRERNLTRRV